MGDLRRRYLEIDPRTLGVLRIALAALLLFDLAKRCPGIDLWHVNSGLLPNHRLLWQPESPYQISYLFALWTESQVHVAFAITALVYLGFLLGYRTRLMHVLSWFGLLSLQTRVGLVANGGDYVFGTLLLWSAFLPLGRRYSLDALLAREQTDGAEAERPIRSLAVAALLLQLSVIYLFNAVNKSGPTWSEGSAVHYLLHQARIVTALGIWARQHVPGQVFAALTHGTLVVEYALPVLILWPWFGAWPRRLAIFIIWTFHGGIAMLTNLGVFSPTMMVFALALLSPEDHRWLAARPRFAHLLARARERVQSLLERVRLREPAPLPLPARETPLGLRVARARTGLREATIAALLVCAASQLVRENEDVLTAFIHRQPRAIRAVVGYLRLNQGWGMFAPDAPRDDMWIVVDAVTEAGHHLDPFNRRASRVADPGLRSVPERLAQNVYFCDYTVRIPGERHFHQALEDWIFDHHRRTRQPGEKIQRFEAHLIEHDSPRPGSSEPVNLRSHVFLRAERDR